MVVDKKQDNLFKNLHGLSSSVDEDFITELFCYLLRFLLKTEPSRVAPVLNLLTANSIEFSLLSDLSIETQFNTETCGTPDIVLSGLNSLIFIEVKVDAKFGEFQLKNYRLALQTSGVLNQQLVTLTRFAQIKENEGVDLALRWVRVTEAIAELELTDPVAIYLRDEFISFLEIRGLAMTRVNEHLADGISSLLSLRNMISEALAKSNYEVDVPTAGQNRLGFLKGYGGTKKVFIGVYFSDPEKVWVNTEYFTFDNSIEVSRGEILNRNWEESLALSSGSLNFFSLSKGRQLLTLEKFIHESVWFVDQLIERLDSVRN